MTPKYILKISTALLAVTFAMPAAAQERPQNRDQNQDQGQNQGRTSNRVPQQSGAALDPIRRYDIAAQPLDTALALFSAQSGRETIASTSLVQGKRSAPVSGTLTAQAAIDSLLVNTGLHTELVDGAFVLRPGQAGPDNSRPSADALITVTGTRIRGAAPIGSPLVTIDREAFDRSGRATVGALLQTIPQNFNGGASESTAGNSIRSNANTNIAYGSSVNLRGLGTASTLTLFDGVRPALGGAWGAFTDISLVPSTMVDRVEILTDGASAIYGSDAVAGVVNIRFRNAFEGLETRARTGSADGDFSEVQLSQIAGTRWKTGGLVAAVEYYRRGSLAGSDRDYFTENLTAFGGPDLRTNFAAPGNILAANGSFFAIPAGQDGRSLTPGQLRPGVINLRDRKKQTDILPEQETLSGYLAADQKLVGALSLFGRAMVARRDFAARGIQNSLLPLPVTPANPFYVDPLGTRQTIQLLYDLSRDFGAEARAGSVDALNLIAGLRATAGSWQFELSGGFGQQLEHAHDLNATNYRRLVVALADPNPATAFNPFGEGGSNNPATIAKARGAYDQRVRYRVWTAALRADGPLFELPAGPVQLAAGAEYRDDRLSVDIHSDLYTLAPTDGTIPGLPGKRQVAALYGELRVPLLHESAIGTLDASLAARYEHYSDFGDTANPKLGLRWQPVEGLALRGSFGTSFRAPFFNELVGEANALFQTLNLPDPQSPTGQTVVLGLFGFKPDLDPEKAMTWTAGFDLAPRALRGLTLSASYFKVRYRDRIAAANSDLFNFLVKRDVYREIIDESPEPATIAAYFAKPRFSNPLGVAPSAIAAIVDGRTRNLSRVDIDGIDFDLRYALPLAGGEASFNIGGTRLFHVDQKITANAPLVPLVGTLGSPVRFRFRSQAGWSSGRFDANIAANYVDGYTNATVSPAEPVGSWTTFDLQLGLTLPNPAPAKSLRFALNIVNLFDRDPPYATYRLLDSAIGYDPEQANAIGRSISLQAIIGW